MRAIGELLCANLQLLQALAELGVALGQCMGTLLQCLQVGRGRALAIEGAHPGTHLLEAARQLAGRITELARTVNHVARACICLHKTGIKLVCTSTQLRHAFFQAAHAAL